MYAAVRRCFSELARTVSLNSLLKMTFQAFSTGPTV